MIIVRRTFDTKGLEVYKDNGTDGDGGVVLTLTHEEFHEVVSKGFTLLMATGMLEAVDKANQAPSVPEEPKAIRDFDGNTE